MITTSRNYLKNKPSFSQVLPQTDKKSWSLSQFRDNKKAFKIQFVAFFSACFYYIIKELLTIWILV